MDCSAYIAAARVPLKLTPQAFGDWVIERKRQEDFNDCRAKLIFATRVAFSHYTLLKKLSLARLHLTDPCEIVMEDSQEELRKHLPIWRNAQGSVLVNGLGLGCVVRGLLANPRVERITVLEKDKSILRIVGHEFASNPRVELILGDALKFPLKGRRWDYAWHDIHVFDGDKPHLSVLHAQLIIRSISHVGRQGAWGMPRWWVRKMRQHGLPLLNS